MIAFVFHAGFKRDISTVLGKVGSSQLLIIGVWGSEKDRAGSSPPSSFSVRGAVGLITMESRALVTRKGKRGDTQRDVPRCGSKRSAAQQRKRYLLGLGSFAIRCGRYRQKRLKPDAHIKKAPRLLKKTEG